MSYNGSGTFNINTTGQPVVAGTVISSSAFNALTTDLATGLTTAITKDGQTTTTARITFAQGFTSSLTTDSSSVSTGSIITGGGVGIAKALYVGTTANVAGAVTLGGIATFSAQPIFSSLTASSAVATDASKGLISVTNTGTGNNVLATSPTLVTPALGTPSAIVLTNATGLSRAALPTGSVLQVIQSVFTGTQSFNSTSAWTDVTSLSASITPTTNTSKILVMFTVHVYGANNLYFRMVRNSTAIGIGDAAGSRQQASSGNGYTAGMGNTTQFMPYSNQYLDSPATTSSTTYKIQFYTNNGAGSGSCFINLSSDDSDAANVARAMSSITIMEISA
jgi:hypothetical protein